ncbi:uncharacterized protein ATNIH1004_004806 [Aspergillus tanneri]|uniref:Tubby C-terminal domain-containing protein n=1 Tax=Aspergillus tanneri TaxID=1220188 RepID=A0A5M9MWE9_9EURO|nr:uncharacterized protein ATNIH1004_004806 [Aspergillus tanneri]KAA8648919.1 hypothetical protein ATNIH1004_004806 [Aspergillus tanneri]
MSDTSTTTKSSSQTFPLAHPPPKSSQCLRLTPRLLLQIQQFTSPARVIPVLEIYQPSRLSKSVPNGLPKLHAHDMYLVQSEPYSHLPSSTAASSAVSSGHDFLGAIYTTPKRGSPNVYLVCGNMQWIAQTTSRGYRFQLKHSPSSSSFLSNNSNSTYTSTNNNLNEDVPPPLELTWDRRPRSHSSEDGTDNTDSRSSTSSSGRFVLCMTDPDHPGPRRPWLAMLTKKGFVVGGWDRAQRVRLAELLSGDDHAVCTCFLALGVYVAAVEGWLT